VKCKSGVAYACHSELDPVAVQKGRVFDTNTHGYPVQYAKTHSSSPSYSSAKAPSFPEVLQSKLVKKYKYADCAIIVKFMASDFQVPEN
jgi:hypothetical protein